MGRGFERRVAALVDQRTADETHACSGIPEVHLAHRVGKVDDRFRPRHLVLRTGGGGEAGRGDQPFHLIPAAWMAGGEDQPQIGPFGVGAGEGGKHDPFLAFMGRGREQG